jgi:hypothetical protein
MTELKTDDSTLRELAEFLISTDWEALADSAGAGVDKQKAEDAYMAEHFPHAARADWDKAEAFLIGARK